MLAEPFGKPHMPIRRSWLPRPLCPSRPWVIEFKKTVRKITLWKQWTGHCLTLVGEVSIMPSMLKPLLTCKEVAEVLKVSRSRAYRIMGRGDFPVLHIGKLRRVRPEDVDRYIHNIVKQGDPASQSVHDED